MKTAFKIYPVILSGGSGTRLWPLSRQSYPKQFLRLNSQKTLFQETIDRFKNKSNFMRPTIVCNESHRFIVAEQAREIEADLREIIVEPDSKNTAPAITLAALSLQLDDPNAIMVVLPCDHLIENHEAFISAITIGAQAAQNNQIATFGVLPDKPETGYGYIKASNNLSAQNQGYQHIERFIEKPSLERAIQYCRNSSYLWNSGIFMFTAAFYLSELNHFKPEIHKICKSALAKGHRDLDFRRLNKKIFSQAENISIDIALMESTQNAVVVPATFTWSDIGSWKSLWENSEKTMQGNVCHGDVVESDCNNSIFHSDGPLITAHNLTDAIVVATQDAILVTNKNADQDIKNLVQKVKSAQYEQYNAHKKVMRPWGSYETILEAENFKVKLLSINPSSQLSLQLHHKRAEHWVVVKGTATVLCGDECYQLKNNQSTYIPKGIKHRLGNLESDTLNVIEVQSGAYLGEDDIIRFDDIYGREIDKAPSPIACEP